MKKKGFTLVELLAVIAILAILVIIALPNVLEMFNRAKKELFLTEAKTIFKETSKKYINESMKGNKITKISNDINKLDIDNNDIKYNIKLDNKGNVTNFNVSNDEYCIKKQVNNLEDLIVDIIENDNCDVFDFSPKPINCNYDGELVQGAEYTYDGYTYRYSQVFVGTGWNNRNTKGWGITLTDKESTSPVTGKICTYINDKPVVFASSMFNGSKASSIDLSSFNTKSIIDMGNMFNNINIKSLDLSTFDTSNVETMRNMFSNSKIENINLENFNTSKVKNMQSMFSNLEIDSLNLSNFNTSKVTNMNFMFENSNIKTLNINSFDTSNVTDMWRIFSGLKTDKLDLKNFNINKVSVLDSMFSGLTTSYLDLSQVI